MFGRANHYHEPAHALRWGFGRANQYCPEPNDLQDGKNNLKKIK
jgi:hypothetical protein